MIGMHFNDTADWDNIPAEVTHLRIWDTGAHWGAIHTAPNTFDWTLLDKLVSKAGDRHLTYVIAGCPRWLAKHPDQEHYAPWVGPGSNSMPWSVDEFNDFCWNLATRYKGRIHAYEVWNEPQLVDFLFPYTTAECNTLATMTKRAYSTIKACDPAALVLAASVLPRETSGGMKRAGKYLRALKAKGWNVDAFTCHLYPEIGTGSKRWKAMLDDVVEGLKSLDAPTKKLWITETTYGLLGPEIPDQKARQLVQDTYEWDGGRFVFWYSWDKFDDLGGMRIAADTAAWAAIKEFG